METKETVLYNLQYLKQLVFEVTDYCNLNCKYCGVSQFYEGHENRNRKMLSFEKARLIIDYIFSVRHNSPGANYPLNFSFYGGEPLLNIQLIKKIVKYARKKEFPHVAFGMTTNGLLLDKHIDYLASNKFGLVISLDGDEFGQSYRVDHREVNSFQKVFTNIKLLQKQFPDYFQKYVIFNSVLHNRNSVESIYHFCKENFDKVPMIAPLNTVGVREDNIMEFKNMYQNINESILKSGNCEMIEAEMFIRTPRLLNLTQYIFKHNGSTFVDFNDLMYNTTGMNTRQTGTCSPFAKKMFVTANGKILQCERIPHQFILGQITNKEVELDLENIAAKQNEFVLKCTEQCVRCYLQKECPQCIYNIESLHNDKPVCGNLCDKENYECNRDITIDYLREHPNYYEKILNEVNIRY